MAAASPPPLRGRDRVGGVAEHQRLGFPPPLTPPRKGEGNPSARVGRGIRSRLWRGMANDGWGAVGDRSLRQTFDGDAARVGCRNGLAAVEQQHCAGFQGQAGEAGGGRQLDRARADGRHVNAQLLPGFGPLASTPLRPALASPRERISATRFSMASVPSAPSMASTLPSATTTAWPASSGPSAARTAKPSSASARPCPLERSGTELATVHQQVRRHLVRAQHLEPLGLEEAHHARQHGIVAAPEHPQNLRQAAEEAHVGAQLPQIGPAHAAGDRHPAAALAAQDRHHAPDLAPVHPGMGKAGDCRIGLALDADDMHRPAARNDALGDRQRQPSTACKNADPVVGHRCAGKRASRHRHRRGAAHVSAWGMHSPRLPRSRMNAMISVTIGWALNSFSTSSMRSTSVPSSANRRR